MIFRQFLHTEPVVASSPRPDRAAETRSANLGIRRHVVA
jgi:hypothetical protein